MNRLIRNAPQKIFLTTVYLALYIPMLILIVYSMNSSKFSLQWHGFSFHWYTELFIDRALWEAFSHSFILGIIAAAVATILSLFTCTYLFLFKSRHQSIITALLLLLIIIPDLVLGIALLIFFNVTGITLGFCSLLIAHITFCIPFAIITINIRLKTLDPNIYFSALDLGATPYFSLVHILLPLLWPAILSSFLLSFTLSFDDVIISYFVAGPSYNILPLTIYSLVRTGITPELNALCSITLIISIILVIIAHRLTGRAI